VSKETLAIELITPDQARQYLTFNTNNRNLRKAHVEKLANDIKHGRWVYNGSTIVFNGDGTLLDGQHRLAAIIDADTPVPITVVRGVSKSAMSTIDANVARSAADAISLTGAAYAYRIAAAARMLITLKEGRQVSQRKMSNSEILEFMNRHPRLAETCAESEAARVMPGSIVGAWLYMAKHVSKMEQEAGEALSVLVSGVPKYQGDPIHVFRERVIKMPAGMKSHHRQRLFLTWTLVAAWNDFLAGETAAICRMRQSEVAMFGVNYAKL
jgi:ParB-like chromosome segregation protein Spo0J